MSLFQTKPLHLHIKNKAFAMESLSDLSFSHLEPHHILVLVHNHAIRVLDGKLILQLGTKPDGEESLSCVQL